MLTKRLKIAVVVCVLLCSAGLKIQAQNPLGRLPGAGSFKGMKGGSAGGDSLRHRTGLEDSITIVFRYLDTTRYRGFDSSLTDFSTRFPVPAPYVFLGNLGNASRSLLFNPVRTAGWDAGFHAFDNYQFNISGTRFYNTTRAFSELGYILGSRTEQFIHLIHTQNITPDWNAAFEYQLANSPGLFKNQSTNHNSYRLNSSYQSRNRRYHAYFIVLNNKIQSAENGGLKNVEDLDNLTTYANRVTIPVHLGNAAAGTGNLFSSVINTGTKYKNKTFFLRQQYDLGIKDSIVTDSTVIPLFYPKFRMEYNIDYSTSDYAFSDFDATDTPYFKTYYGPIPDPDSVLVRDNWKQLSNDISLYQFPDSKNAQQFIKVGATVQTLKGQFDHTGPRFHNIFVHGEYRNKTKNKKWDMEANGQLYPTGLNAGDYNALVSLKRYISKQIGYLQVGFQNVNRRPSFVFDSASSFSLQYLNLNKENITNLFGSLEQPHLRLRLTGNYFLVNNYTYYTDFYTPRQTPLFNLLQVGAEKAFRLSNRITWYADVVVQQKTGSAPIHVPLIYNRNRIEFAGNLGFKNLDFHLGTEIKYHTRYKADGYSPVLGQYFSQDTTTIALKMPHIDAYLHFRIKTFTAYVRAANLNTASFKKGFGFTNQNIEIPGYPYQGLQLRLGIFWTFIN